MRLRFRNSIITLATTAFAIACTSPSQSGGAAPAPAGGESYDVIIVNGRVVDGSGNAWFYGDVALKGDRIVRVVRRGQLGHAAAAKRIDATGMVVSPGFIDIQGQSGDLFLRGDGRDVGKLTQGVTTEILGEAYTVAPVSALTLADNASDTATLAMIKPFQGAHGFDAWLRAMQAHGISPNVGSFVGASTIREYAMGLHMGAAPAEKLDSMRVAMRHGMEDGAMGLGSALIYPPGNYASTEELIEIAKAMSPYGGVYITHMRSEADQYLGNGRGDSHWPGRARPGRDLSSEGGGETELGEGGTSRREDRLGARGRNGCAGEHVSVHGGRHRARCVSPAVGVGRRKAVRESRRLGEAREDPRGHRAPEGVRRESV
ncbi:MAG TPA: hypothetical protein VK511_05645 [Gemmatimonadaceae bacterium]|nr:hypothetical protein [Gemmatimonadaceae bacterium]